MWAAHWLAQGLDGEGIVALASVDKTDVRAVHDAIPAALRDAGIEPMSEVAAAARLAFNHIARMHLGARAGWRWVISAVTGAFDQNNCATELLDEPLGSLLGFDDEVTGGWGRDESDIAAAVREACERQVQVTRGSG